MPDRMRVLGIDLGIASCGWAVLEFAAAGGGIAGAGVRCFDAPLVDKTGEPKSAERRAARGQRRVLRRRSQRMAGIRRILHDHGVLTDAVDDALARALRRISPGDRAQITPWTLRAAAFDRPLSGDEFAVVLGHIARHRGFRSNSKRDAAANAAAETSKMKKAMEETREALAKYRSFGDMLANDPRFETRKRNRDKDYSHTAKRSDLEDEVRLLLAAQRRFGNSLATPELEADFSVVAFSQRPLQDSDGKVGPCPFEPEEKRTAKCSPSFEMFRYLQKLVNLKLTTGRFERTLSPEEIAIAAREFGEQKGVTYKTLRKLLDLDANTRFAGVPPNKEGLDVAARAGKAATGTRVLRDVLGDVPWQSLQRTPDKLDRIAELLSFREDLGSIRSGLAGLGLDTVLVDQLVAEAEKGAFNDFTGAAHISVKAARNIIPGLRDGLVFSEACARVGYDHAARPAISLDDIGSPVTRRAFGEALKQIKAVAREFGPIDTVHIELARDVGKSAEERKEIERGIEVRNAEKDRQRDQAASILGRAVGNDELLRYELAAEQLFKCVYCGSAVAPDGFAANDTRYQVDHILPWDRFGDDSYLNKTLCCAKCNQDKRGRTPFEWFSADKAESDWNLFVARFESLVEMKGLKKRNLRLRDAASVEEKFKARNLFDTRWATRLLADKLKQMFPAAEGTRRVFARPGAITSKLRRAWGLSELKKVDGERVDDDRHHAVDAIVIAATPENLLQGMTREVQARRREGREDDPFLVPAPWREFRRDVVRAVYGEDSVGGIFVSRAERRRARGKAHDATVREVRDVDGEEVVFERKAIERLTEKDLDRIPNPAPYNKAVDPGKLRDEMVRSLRAWMTAGKPKGADQLPRSPKGDIIRKVRVATTGNVAIPLRGGTVDRGDMARVDIFRKKSRKDRWEFYAVPIYPHQIASMEHPPDRAVVAYKSEGDWAVVDATFEFLWSLTPMSYVKITKSGGEEFEGYFRGLHRGTGAVNISDHSSLSKGASNEGIGIKTLRELRKFTVDRLGRRFEVLREVRTWRGKACT